MVSDWTFFLAIATFSLAGAAFWAIWQNYRFRKEDKDFKLRIASLDNIHQWLLDILTTTHLYLTAVREGNEKQKFITRSQCTFVRIRGGDMLVAAGLFGVGLLTKVKQVEQAASKYLDALDLLGKTSIEDEIVENFSEAIGDALLSLGKEKLKMLPEYFEKEVEEEEEGEEKKETNKLS